MANGFWFHDGWVGEQPPHEAPAGSRWECYVSKTDRELWMNGGRRRWYLVQEWQPPKDACAQSLKAIVNTSPGIVDE